MKTTRLFLTAAVVLLAVLSTATAQVSMGAINGLVTDSSGATVSGAVVLLTNLETQVTQNIRTNASGLYIFLNVISGEYAIEVSSAGFRISKSAPFRISVNQTATHDFAMQLGTLDQSVTVEGVGTEVQASTSELGATVTGKQVVDLPLNGRNFTQLLALTPGVAQVSVASNNGGADAKPIGVFTFPAINGQSNRSNYFMLDGMNNQGSSFGTFVVAPIVDAIQEFKVQSHNDQAEFGQALGGIINVVTKSGTNQLHGGAWEFLRNDVFDARSFFLPRVTPFRQNHFGATLGGPVVLPKIYNGLNRTFFFLGYQGFRFRQPAQTLYRVATPANIAGDLSDWPRQIYNPYTTRPDPARPGSFIRDPFPGNRIPASLLDPGAVLYLKSTMPAPIATGVADRNALDQTPQRRNAEEYTARVDHSISEKDSVWFRISGGLQDATTSGGREGLITNDVFRSRNYGASYVRVFNPTNVLQVQVSRARAFMDFFNQFRSLPADFIQSVGFSPAFAGNFIDGKSIVPQINITDYFSGGEGGAVKWPTMIWQERVNYTRIQGRHNLKFGFDLSSNAYREISRSARVGFQSTQTNDPQNPGVTGNALASFLLNAPDSALRNNIPYSTRFGGVLGLFAHDQWKVTKSLTLNIGLRWDLTIIPPYGRPEDGNHQVGNLDLNRGVYIVQYATASCAEAKTAPCIPTTGGTLPANVEYSTDQKLFKNSTDNWQPRFGLAYRLADRTALRASFGIVFDNWAGVLQGATNPAGLWPSIASQSTANLNVPTATQLTPSIKATNPFPTGGVVPAATPFEQVAFFRDPNGRNPYSLQYNFGIQHQVSASTLLNVNYVGSGSRRLDLGGFYNTALTPGPGDPRLRSPFPYIRPTRYQWSWGRSSYHALQTLFEKRMSNGLNLMASYTWSKSIDIGCSGWFGVEGCSVQNPYNFNADRAPSGFDITHNLAVNWAYQLPVGPGRTFSTGQRVVDYIIGNWQLNGIATIRSGTPYSLTVPGDTANIGNNNYMRPNLVGDPTISDPQPIPGLWFNKAAFAAPAPFTFGNFGRNRLRSDYFRNFDLSVFRQFRIREVARVEFRAEAFNAFNTPTFAAPTGNINSPNFGRVTSIANTPRQLQLALKVLF